MPIVHVHNETRYKVARRTDSFGEKAILSLVEHYGSLAKTI